MARKEKPPLARSQIMGQNSSDAENSNVGHLCITLTLLTVGCLCVGKQGVDVPVVFFSEINIRIINTISK